MTSTPDLINYILKTDSTRSQQELETLPHDELVILKVKIEFRNTSSRHNTFKEPIPHTRRRTNAGRRRK
ncbi:MAG: hypothetical protein JJE25_01465 [Bacteroidia bacterium]|nr:hypothetical protein [Bacteroidia bacterium]